MDKHQRPSHVYVARESCGCVVGVVNDGLGKFTAKAVAEWITDGLAVQRETFEDYRARICKEPGFMDCPHGQQQLL